MILRILQKGFKANRYNLVHLSKLKSTDFFQEKITKEIYRKKTNKKPPSSSKLWFAGFLFLGVANIIDYSWLKKNLFPNVIADGAIEDSKEDENDEEDDEEDEQLFQRMKGRESIAGFRARKIVEYENRLRQYSTPDKLFRYFATIQLTFPDGSSEIFMTPSDFLRSITPGIKQPDGFGLDQFLKYDEETIKKKIAKIVKKDSIFTKFGSSGLISFSDYLFLLTVLSTSKKHFEIAFRMFDLKGDGIVDFDEFEKVTSVIIQQTTVGSRHRDHGTTGNTFKGINRSITVYFFGPNLKQKLTIEQFLKFQENLQNEILELEFNRKNPDEDGKIKEVDFADLLLAYSGYPDAKRSKVLKRVKSQFKEVGEGIDKEEFLNFFRFLVYINDVDTALTFYNIAGASIDQETFKHVARTVSEVEISDHVIKVIFSIFDEKGEGHLNNKEFTTVMKNRLLRGLEKPKDLGFIKLLRSVAKCAAESAPTSLIK